MAAFKCFLVMAFMLLAGSAVMPIATAADADPLVDFLIPGKSPQEVKPSDFVSSVLREAFKSNPEAGKQNIVAANAASFPALNNQGISFVVLKFGANGGQNAPHEHPRATEIFFLIKGEVEVTVVDTTGKAFTNTLRAGDTTVFPRGLAHSIINKRSDTALAIAALNSANPGVIRLEESLALLKEAMMGYWIH